MSLDRRFRQFREKMSLLVAQRSVVVLMLLLLASTSACSAGASAQKVVGGGDDGDAAVPSYPHNWREESLCADSMSSPTTTLLTTHAE